MNDQDQIIYDVCNDYSLDPADHEPAAGVYRIETFKGGSVYTHKKHDEIHYYKGPKGLDGQYLHNLEIR